MSYVSSITKMFKKDHMLSTHIKFYQLNLVSSVKIYSIKFGRISCNSFSNSYNQEASNKDFLNPSLTVMVKTFTNKYQLN